MRDANATVEWTPEYMGKRMDDWLVNMGDWNISRRRYYGLPLPFYPCALRPPERDRLEGGARGAGAAAGSTSSRSCAGRGSTRCRSRCEQCGEEVRADPRGRRRLARRRHRPVLDARLAEPGVRSTEGYATGAAKGLTTADLPDHAYWEEWFPADWVSEMREQIRLWFYSQLFMSVALTGRAPFRKVLGYEKMLDETGREMHGSWGNTIDAPDAFARMGADVMRWQYCAQPPDQNLLFGFGPGARDPAQAADALELASRSSSTTPTSRASGPTCADLATARRRAAAARPLARRADARSSSREATDGLRGVPHRRRDPRLRDVRRRPLELVHPPLAAPLLGRRRRPRCARSGTRSSQALRVVAPVMPFLTEHLWQTLVRDAAGEPPTSVFLAGWPERRRRRRRAARRGRRACAASSSSAIRRARRRRLKLRQPLRRLVVEGAPLAASHADEIADELRVKEVEFGPVEATELRVQAEPARARPEARQGARRRARRARGRRVRAARRAAASASPATSSAPTRCSSSARARRAGRSRRTTASPSRSTRRSTTSSSSRAASTT